MCGCRQLHRIEVDQQGFVYVDGVKVARYDEPRRVLQFYDKDRRRCAERGSSIVEVSVDTLAGMLEIRDGLPVTE